LLLLLWRRLLLRLLHLLLRIERLGVERLLRHLLLRGVWREAELCQLDARRREDVGRHGRERQSRGLRQHRRRRSHAVSHLLLRRLLLLLVRVGPLAVLRPWPVRAVWLLLLLQQRLRLAKWLVRLDRQGLRGRKLLLLLLLLLELLQAVLRHLRREEVLVLRLLCAIAWGQVLRVRQALLRLLLLKLLLRGLQVLLPVLRPLLFLHRRVLLGLLLLLLVLLLCRVEVGLRLHLRLQRLLLRLLLLLLQVVR
jgi:hypothetical protein